MKKEDNMRANLAISVTMLVKNSEKYLTNFEDLLSKREVGFSINLKINTTALAKNINIDNMHWRIIFTILLSFMHITY